MPTQVITGVIVARPDPPSLTQLEFASRFSLEEQVALDIAMETAPNQTDRSTLRVIEKNLLRATSVDVADPRTVLGATICVDTLVAAGLVPPQDRDARLAAILTPPDTAVVTSIL